MRPRDAEKEKRKKEDGRLEQIMGRREEKKIPGSEKKREKEESFIFMDHRRVKVYKGMTI